MTDSNISCLCFRTCFETESLNLKNCCMCIWNRVEDPRQGDWTFVRVTGTANQELKLQQFIGICPYFLATRSGVVNKYFKLYLNKVSPPQPSCYLLRGSRSCITQPSDGHLPQSGIGVPGALIHQDQHVTEVPVPPKDRLLHELKSTHSSPLVKGAASLQESGKGTRTTVEEEAQLLMEQRRKGPWWTSKSCRS